DRTDILACGRTRGLGVAAGADGNRPRLHLSSESVIELAARARHRSHRHRFRRSGTIENKGSGGPPPSCGGVVLGCAVAFLVTWCMSKIWAPPVAQEQGGH